LIQRIVGTVIFSPFDSGDRTITWHLSERRIHRFFQISVIFKGLHALAECAGGIALYLIGTDTIVHWVDLLTQEEISKDPRDFIATHLMDLAQHLSVGSQSFYAFYLLSHGLVKIFLVAGLLREKLWAYPTSLVVLAAFIVYQVYRYSYTHSPGLIFLTVFDLVIIVLVWHEWRILRSLISGRAQSQH
jgi:uncharacterized membrane protein